MTNDQNTNILGEMSEEALLRLAANEPTREPLRNYLAPSPDELAELFPDLETILIGSGGMGCVFRARQKKLDRVVALKILPRELAADDLFAERFAREARAMARLNHPNIVAIHDFGAAGDVYYLTMTYMDGMNLRELLDTGPLDPQQAMGIFSQVGSALAYAHEEGVVHRDIKPENILFNKQGHISLADFGLARLAMDSNCEISLTQTRQAMGTLNYMAPEQYEDPKSVDHRADIYAMGVLLYELMTGKIPRGSFPPVTSINSNAPVHIDDVINRALQVRPEDRFPNMQAMLDAAHGEFHLSEIDPTGNGTFTKFVNAGRSPMRLVNRIANRPRNDRKPDPRVSPVQKARDGRKRKNETGRWLPLHWLTYIALAITAFLLLFPWQRRGHFIAFVETTNDGIPMALLLPTLAIMSQLAKYRRRMHPFRWFAMTVFLFVSCFVIATDFYGNELQTVFMGTMILLAIEYILVIAGDALRWLGWIR